MRMKIKVKMMAIACIAALSCQAQNTIFPTRDLYDTGSMMMYLDAVRHRAANREASYEAYAREMERRLEYERRESTYKNNVDLAVKNLENRKWKDVIGNVNAALRTGFWYPELYYFRGLAYENLGYYAYAIDDYKTGKKKGSTNAANALKELKKTLKRIRKETKGMK